MAADIHSGRKRFCLVLHRCSAAGRAYCRGWRSRQVVRRFNATPASDAARYERFSCSRAKGSPPTFVRNAAGCTTAMQPGARAAELARSGAFTDGVAPGPQPAPRDREGVGAHVAVLTKRCPRLWTDAVTDGDQIPRVPGASTRLPASLHAPSPPCTTGATRAAKSGAYPSKLLLRVAWVPASTARRCPNRDHGDKNVIGCAADRSECL
jgi:hypothetical protein